MFYHKLKITNNVLFYAIGIQIDNFLYVSSNFSDSSTQDALSPPNNAIHFIFSYFLRKLLSNKQALFLKIILRILSLAYPFSILPSASGIVILSSKL